MDLCSESKLLRNESHFLYIHLIMLFAGELLEIIVISFLSFVFAYVSCHYPSYFRYTLAPHTFKMYYCFNVTNMHSCLSTQHLFLVFVLFYFLLEVIVVIDCSLHLLVPLNDTIHSGKPNNMYALIQTPSFQLLPTCSTFYSSSFTLFTHQCNCCLFTHSL